MSLWYWDKTWHKAGMYRSHVMSKAILACPGPSLKETKNLTGPGRFVVGINTSYPTVRPDLWIGMDEAWCYDSNLLAESFPKIFRGTYAEMHYNGSKVKEMPYTYFADVAYPPAGKTMLDLLEKDVKFSWHYHTLGTALHVIMWLGFKEIYLVGCDLGGKGDYCHSLILNQEQRNRNQRLYSQQYFFLKKLNNEALKNNIKIISSTQNSPINDFLTFVSIDNISIQTQPSLGPRYVTDRPH